MTTEPLLLAARELARGSVASLSIGFEIVASATSATHFAVLFWSQTQPHCVRLGVFRTDEGSSADNYELVDIRTVTDDGEIAQSHMDEWTLVWSPDLKFIVISGRISRAGGASEGVMWIFARSDWLAPPDASIASRATSLLLCIEPSKYLAAKYWNPATNIVRVFFATQNGSKACVLSENGVWLLISIQLATLSLGAMNPAVLEDTGLFTIKVVKNLTEWHAGVSAACYDPKNAMLVVSGGVRNPSKDLVRSQAASLSIWKVVVDKDKKNVCELLDYTMVLKANLQHLDDEANSKSESGLSRPIIDGKSGLLSSVTSLLFAPFKMMVQGGTTETRVLRGWIRHLEIAPNGNLVSMVDDRGRLAIRQIDVCTEVLTWQTIEDVCVHDFVDVAIRRVVWLTSDLVALVLTTNSVVYCCFDPYSNEAAGLTSKDNDDKRSQSTGRLVRIPAQYYRPTGTDSIQTLALDAVANVRRLDAYAACEFVMNGDLWVVNQLQPLAVGPFIEMLVNAHRFEDALATVALHKASGKAINSDSIHRRLWLNYRKQAGRLYKEQEGVLSYPQAQTFVFLMTRPRKALQRGQSSDFVKALDHLRAVSDKHWVLSECMTLIADDSSANMKLILDLAWDAWLSLHNDDKDNLALSQKREKLERYVYRLETLRLLLCEEMGVSTTSVACDQLFEGKSYVLFNVAPIVSTAKQFALEGRVCALSILFQRHGYNVLPYWLEILKLIPPSVSPSTYAQLLPAIPTLMDKGVHYYTLSKVDDLPGVEGDENLDMITSVRFFSENRHQDLSTEELLAFENFINVPREERNEEYGAWFAERIVELDEWFGQLAIAYKLSKLALMCLRGWTALEARKPLEELVWHTERLYQCVYPLCISTCCLLSLKKWSALSLHDQAMIVVGSNDKDESYNAGPMLDRLDIVFKSQRCDRTYALDELFAWLAQKLASEGSLIGLMVAAQLIQQSNPSIALANRWIQSNSRLIETALGVIYAVNVSDVLGDDGSSVDTAEHLRRYHALVDQLWIIFQSLPARKERDLPEIAQLQVAVDEMEGFMVTMDVLTKYRVVALPRYIKFHILATTDGTDNRGGPLDLLEQMCDFALPGSANQWLEVLQDAMQLKEHALGERLSQPQILDVILKHLLEPGRIDMDAAQNVVNHWITSDVQAMDDVLKKLLRTMQSALDSVVGYSEDYTATAAHEAAFGCIGIIKHVLALPLWDDRDRAAAEAKEHYESLVSRETDVAYACELLDLLTDGAVKLSPLDFRADKVEEQEQSRLDAVYQIFVTNPSHYKLSVRAMEWLAHHHVSGVLPATADDQASDPLAAVMHLAKLLRVESHKLNIYMKGAYAALHCMDYDVACQLTMQVLDTLPADVSAKSKSDSQLTQLHLISIVLDLVSACSFQSWSKKRQLCLALLSVSSLDLFAHQAMDLLLYWLDKIEAIQALMVELGFSESDLAQRQRHGNNSASGPELVLLTELKGVVDLLHQAKTDRNGLLKLLQCGFRLTQVMRKDATGCDNQVGSISVSSFLQQIVQLCVAEAVELTSGAIAVETSGWQQYMDMGLSHLMLWSDLCLDDATFEAFCMDTVLASAFPQDPVLDSSNVVVRRCHHFFLFQAAQAKEYMLESDRATLLARRKRLETLASSYAAVQKAVGLTEEPGNGAVRDVTSVPQHVADSRLLMSDRRYHCYVKLAQQCHEQLLSQQTTHELDQVSAISSTEVNLKRFSQDLSYRSDIILNLARRKEHFQLAQQLASKFDVDGYACVLAYIKHALVFPSSTRQIDRRRQLDQAFAIAQVDVLKEALQRPSEFGDFLLQRTTMGEPSVYEAINGRDHVGVLLVLRMVLECSKRLRHETRASVIDQADQSRFPLPKPVVDRISLLFLCLKQLKCIGDSLETVDCVDFKLIGAASTTTELLTPWTCSDPPLTSLANRKVAVEAVQPLLASKSIKVVTKIIRKLHHRVTPSAMVMIYIKKLLSSIWKEHGMTSNSPKALSTNLAVYAYESCVPYLSVLSSEHLIVFQYFFLDESSGKPFPELVAYLDLEDEFYGQQLNELSRFGRMLTPRNRVQIVADTLTMLQTRYNSCHIADSQSNVSSASSTSSIALVAYDSSQSKRIEHKLLYYLERELAENICYWVLSEIKQSGLTVDAAESTLSMPLVETSIKAWFALASEQPCTANEKDSFNTGLRQLCQQIPCVELASLIMEMLLRCGSRKTQSEEKATSTILQMYQQAVVDLMQQCMGMNNDKVHESPAWVGKLVMTWVTASCAVPSNQQATLARFLEGTGCLHASARGVYTPIVQMLSQSPSNLLKAIGLRRLQELQPSTDENDTQSASVVKAARNAIVSQWQKVIAQYEDKHQWVEAAVLSHVLVTSVKLEAASDDFGLYVKAIWAALLGQFRQNECTKKHQVFLVPSRDIFTHFTDVFEELVAFIEGCSDNVPFAELATMALSHVLMRYTGIKAVGRSANNIAQCSVSAWQCEQQYGVQIRVWRQFHVGSEIARTAPTTLDSTCWSALFARGAWGSRLVNWYTTRAYAALMAEEEVTKVVIMRLLETNCLNVAIPLLLSCPFDSLRENYVACAFAYLRQVPQGSCTWFRVMELVLLRFDIAVLLQHDMYSFIVAFVLQDACPRPTLWTSSGSYLVCALVTLGELAAAGRLTCAVRHAHPLLWDVENARLLLVSYLRSLSSVLVRAGHEQMNHNELSYLQHKVYVQTYQLISALLLEV